ncbi:NAD(P)/FAD-dependent oxidoreductase [Nocardia panacis]|uniref:NAD(P)/FAD-dependent oxidoreductase n=1 Tax=Nocardia panacis TaxID=2340916 RepID=A0A3A4JZ54_9NOCA|nr:NAD(P)/FAD-dependent oxidoreductase [Nocardia panacis]RJO69846.1 NAD(P)/FAD-dependent oxidoreductase [Nocardia panacis]
MTEQIYDTVVIGGGAAGLSAALVLGRAMRRVAVVRGGAARNAPAQHMHGYLSREGMPPHELLTLGAAEVADYGGELLDDEVSSAEKAADGRTFTVRLVKGGELRARRLLVATGLRDVLPEIAGAAERWGHEVLHCPYCHAYEVRDQRLAVIGGTEPGALARAFHLGVLVPQWSQDTMFFPHTMLLSAEQRARLAGRGVIVVDGEVVRFVITDDRLRGVELADGRIIERDAVFVGPTFVPNAAVLESLGATFDAAGWPVTDPSGQTTVAGVWAAGNVNNPGAQVITAAGAGSTAAIALNASLAEEDSPVPAASM